MKASIPEGYACDPLQASPIIFLGSCDMSGPIEKPELIWSRALHREFSERFGAFPYIGLSRVHSGYDALLRRLHSYCKTYGPPKKLFAVIPRPVCVEIPIRGTLVNVTEREQYLGYLVHINALAPFEYAQCLKAMELARSQQDNPDYQLYHFEKSSAFLESICERYGIELKWTPNVSSTAVDYYYRWLELFLKNCPWMAERFTGVAAVSDFAPDGSTGAETQASIADVLMNNGGAPINTARLLLNHAYLKSSKFYAKVISDANRKIDA
jgi:hypothetical protein